jgi:hypothetical protein
MRAARAETTDTDKVGTMRAGVLAQKHLLFGKDGSPTNYVLNMPRAGAGGWRTPRHRHGCGPISLRAVEPTEFVSAALHKF